MISPYRIGWRNSTNATFDCVVGLAFDSDEGEISSYLNKEAVLSESYDGSMRRITNYKYNEVFSPRLTFVKANYSDFTISENRQILSWLTGSKKASWLSVYHDETNTITYQIYGNFTEVQLYKSSNGRIIGYVCTFESVSPYAFSSLNTVTNTTGSFTINCQSDEQDSYIYPKIAITPASASNIRLQNTTTNTTVDIVGNSAGETVTIDGSNRVVSSSINNRVIGSDFSWNWLPIQLGNNNITVSLYTTVMTAATGFVAGTQYWKLENGLYIKVNVLNATEYATYNQLYIANYWSQASASTFSVSFEWRDIKKIGEV